MGIHARVRNSKKSRKDRSLNQWHRAKKAEKKKSLPPQTVIIEDAHLFSVDKMKNKLRNPKNNIAITGKKRQRLMKRLRHQLREDSVRQVEVPSHKLSRKSVPSKVDEDSNEEVMQEEIDEADQQWVDVKPTTSTTASTSTPSKKKKRKKGKKSASAQQDVDMEEV